MMVGTKLAHQAFLYDGAQQLAEAMTPVVRAGLESGDTVLVTAKRASAEALREELGSDGAAVELHDTSEWYPRPVHRLMALQRAIDALAPDSRLLALDEPVCTGSAASRREWARYQSAIDVALADEPLRFIGLYDRCELPDGFEPPADVGDLDAGGRSEVGQDHRAIPFTGDYRVFRDMLSGLALESGMSADRAEELVLAANEVVTNAVVHGAPPIVAHCWTADGDFVCEVSDGGPGVADPLAGWMLPEAGAPGGWGLAVTRRICDALEFASGDGGGSRVRLYAALRST